MNATEKLAYEWLIKKYKKHNVITVNNGSGCPDFIVPKIGCFEAKKLYNNKIMITSRQEELLGKMDSPAFLLLFTNTAEPTVIIPFKELVNPEKNRKLAVYKGYSIVWINTEFSRIQLKTEQKERLQIMAQQLELGSVEALIQQFIDIGTEAFPHSKKQVKPHAPR